MKFDELMGKHLMKPSGLFGKLVGIIMNKGNDVMNRFTIQRLDPSEHDAILEIGFGNGKYIGEIAKITRSGLVAGIDYSETMVTQARKRNRRLIQQGKVEIHYGTADQLPFADDSFHKIFTVNTIYFWPSPEKELAEIYRVLKPKGTCMISFRSKHKMEQLPFTKNGFKLYEQSDVINLVKNAGFQDISLESIQDGTLDINCVMAMK